MIKYIYCIRDESTTFMDPEYFANDEIAKVSFGNALISCIRSGKYNFPINDMNVYKLGSFNDETGELHFEKEFIANCSQCINIARDRMLFNQNLLGIEEGDKSEE